MTNGLDIFNLNENLMSKLTKITKRQQERSESNEDISVMPSFEDQTFENVSFSAGSTAYLHCRINNLGYYRVVWVRGKDSQT